LLGSYLLVIIITDKSPLVWKGNAQRVALAFLPIQIKTFPLIFLRAELQKAAAFRFSLAGLEELKTPQSHSFLLEERTNIAF
jgi:hypothetical protein